MHLTTMLPAAAARRMLHDQKMMTRHLLDVLLLLLTITAWLPPWGAVAVLVSPRPPPLIQRPPPSPQPRQPSPTYQLPRPPPSPQPKPPPNVGGSIPHANGPSTVLLLEGTLTYRTSEPNGTWFLSARDGINTYLLPGQPVDAESKAPIAPGNLVSLACQLLNALSNECTAILNAKISRMLSSEVDTVNVTLRLLVVIVKLDCDTLSNQPATKDAVQDTFLAANGIADFFTECSYGRMAIDRDALKVISINLTCSDVLLRSCWDWAMPSALSESVNDRLKLQSAGIALSSFSHIAYVIPSNPYQKCSWRGMGDIPGTKSWYIPEPKGIFKKGTVMQELLHNFGMYHGYDKDGREYEDYSTAMGRGDSCPSAPELWRLGWAEPMVELNSTSLPAATFKTFNLRATYLGPEGAMIKIKPDWLGRDYMKNVYLSLRVKSGGDRDLLDQYDGKLSIHRVEKVSDVSFRIGPDPKISLLDAISPRSSYNYSDYNLQILTGDFIPWNSSIVVKICRYINRLECNGSPVPSPPNPSPIRISPARQPPPTNKTCGTNSQDGIVNCQATTPPSSSSSSSSGASTFIPGVVQCGRGFTCVLSTAGAIKCFGFNSEGQLGLGDRLKRGDRTGTMGPYLPTVDLGPNRKATAIATGADHVCALLQPGGIIKCWGSNVNGELGLGDTDIHGDGPFEMGSNLTALDLGTGLTATAITAGYYHVCALLQPGGLFKCWGWNLFGQLGLGDTASRGDQPGEMGSNLPVVDLGTAIASNKSISPGYDHTCALQQPGGIVKCWGLNSAGQLGIGDKTNRGDKKGQMGDSLPPVNLGRGYNDITAIAAGYRFTCALLQPGGVIKCWGSNGNGQLGQGDTVDRYNPSTVKPIDLGSGYTATAISTGYGHACAMLQPGGIIKCWGDNYNGQLGLGNTNNRGDQPNEMGDSLPPVDLGPGLRAAAIDAGWMHTCALLQPGNIVKCWGYNAYGQLGQEDIHRRGNGGEEMGANLPPISLQ